MSRDPHSFVKAAYLIPPCDYILVYLDSLPLQDTGYFQDFASTNNAAMNNLEPVAQAQVHPQDKFLGVQPRRQSIISIFN